MGNDKYAPWIRLRRRGRSLTAYHDSSLIDPAQPINHTSFCLLIGHTHMSTVIKSLTSRLEGHSYSDIYLHPCSSTRGRSISLASGPTQLLDIPLEQDSLRGDIVPRLSDDFGAELPALYSCVLGPFTDVICTFLSDFSTSDYFVNFVAGWLTHAVKLSHCILPRLIIVVSDDQDGGEKWSIDWMKDFRLQLRQKTAIPLAAGFSNVEVCSIPSAGWESNGHLRQRLKEKLMNQSTIVQCKREESQLKFNKKHFAALFSQAYKSFIHQGNFSYILASRASCPIPSGAAKSIASFIKDFSEPVDLQSLAIPILASSIILNAFPPGMHLFNPQTVYQVLYSPICWNVFKALRLDPKRLESLEDLVVSECHLEDLSKNQERHLRKLQSFNKRWKNYKNDECCLLCLVRRPEYSLPCGHCFCEQDIIRFGNKVEESTWVVESCLLCQKSTQGTRFRIKPPTKGVNVLGIDGGGVRGIIPLQNLYLLEQKLKPFLPHYPVQNHFDLSIGTSSGGLIVLAAVLQGIPVSRCIKIFKKLSAKAFRGRYPRRKSVFSRAIKLVVSIFADSVYPSGDIEDALKEQFGDKTTLLDHNAAAARGAKVGVVVTGVPNGEYVITNYNGVGSKTSIRGYKHVVGANQSGRLKVWDAARATTAAPWYFTPHNIAGKKYQDGGLWRNNPLDLGKQEAWRRWKISKPDLALSLGTGHQLVARSPSSPQSPLTPDIVQSQEPNSQVGVGTGRFLKRLLQSFLDSVVMDGEKFHDLITHLHQQVGDMKQSFRLGLELPGSPPALDNISSIEALRLLTERQQNANPDLDEIAETMLSTLFYFELSSKPIKRKSRTCCQGRIICNIEPGPVLSHLIQALEQKGYAFSLSNQNIPILTSTQAELSTNIYQETVSISVKSLDSIFHITLQHFDHHGLNDHSISGSPFTINDLMQRQGWMSPFGREDYGPIEPAPQVHRKRKQSSIHCNRRKRARRAT